MGSTCSCWDQDQTNDLVQSLGSHKSGSKKLESGKNIIVSEYEYLPSLELPMPSNEHSLVKSFKISQFYGQNSPSSGDQIDRIR